MTALALIAPSDRFSVLTISERRDDAPVWHRRLGWPAVGDDHLTLDADSAARRDRWASRIDQAVLRADRAVLLVAEGLGCAAAAWWARLSPRHYADRVAGALLFDPVPPTGPTGALLASPAIPLPFPSMLVTARPALAGDAGLDALAQSWGSRTLIAQRPRTPAAWRGAHRLIARMAAAVVARDIDRGMALRGE